MQVFNKIN